VALPRVVFRRPEAELFFNWEIKMWKPDWRFGSDDLCCFKKHPECYIELKNVEFAPKNLARKPLKTSREKKFCLQ